MNGKNFFLYERGNDRKMSGNEVKGFCGKLIKEEEFVKLALFKIELKILKGVKLRYS